VLRLPLPFVAVAPTTVGPEQERQQPIAPWSTCPVLHNSHRQDTKCAGAVLIVDSDLPRDSNVRVCVAWWQRPRPTEEQPWNVRHRLRIVSLELLLKERANILYKMTTTTHILYI
jgi:hypothetical protein